MDENGIILKEFYEYWDRVMDKSKGTRAFNRMEQLGIEIFYDWLVDRYDLVPKIGVK